MLASMLGHSVIVEQVANKGEPELREIHRRKALWWAALNGHEAVVRQLLEKGLSDATMFELLLPEFPRDTDAIIRYEVLADPEDYDGRAWYMGCLDHSQKGSKPIVDLLVAYGAKLARNPAYSASDEE